MGAKRRTRLFSWASCAIFWGLSLRAWSHEFNFLEAWTPVAFKGFAEVKGRGKPRTSLRAQSEQSAFSKISAEMNRAMEENPALNKLGLCFPDSELIVEALYRSTDNYTNSAFLDEVDRVFRQFHAWPSAWPGIVSLLDVRHPWTLPYCEKVVASAVWSPFPFFAAKNLPSLRPLQRYSLGELQEQSDKEFAVLDRWLKELAASDDSTTRSLLEKFREQDLRNREEQVMNLRALDDLLGYLLSKVLRQLFIASAASPTALKALLSKRNPMGRTVLHQAAESGNGMLADLIVQMVPADVPQYVSLLDNGGYSAEDLARLGSFDQLAENLRAVGAMPSGAPESPVELFPGASRKVAATDSGGWDASDAGAVPAEWLPAAGQCPIDCISVSQFDWDVFEKHYVQPKRPLLVRGGVQLSAGERQRFTRAGLLEIAGKRMVRAFSTPYEDDWREVPPVEMTIKDYADFLDARIASGSPSSNLSYVFDRLPANEEALDFANPLPRLFQGKVEQRSTQFTLGGVLMGSPLHFHIDAVNSLMFGKKLWLLKPPSEQQFRKTVVYEDLQNGGLTEIRVLQEAGDLLYIPRDWVHGVLCLQHCVGLAHEFDPIVKAPSTDDDAIQSLSLGGDSNATSVFGGLLVLAAIFVVAAVFATLSNF